MTNPTNYLALDIGAESGRAIIGTISNGTISLVETHRFLNRPLQDSSGLFWDASSIWRNIKEGIKISSSRCNLSSMATDTWGADFALLDKNGKRLGNPHHYRDARTKGMLNEALRYVSRDQIFAYTGNHFLEINTLYQLLSMVLNRDPHLIEANTFLTMLDLFNHWLCGSLSCEFTNATTTQCYNPRSQTWVYSLLEALNIPTHIFPKIRQPGTSLGILLPAIAAETDSGPIPVIAPACHDTGSAVAAVPASSTNFAWLSSGTWSILGTEVHEPVLNEKVSNYNFTNEGGVFDTWRLSKNIMGLWLIQECKREWHLSYDEITHLATKAQPFLAVIDPDNEVFLQPGKMPEKIQAYCREYGQAVPGTQGEIARVVLESLALKYRLTFERLEDLCEKSLDPIYILGGGAKNSLLNQFTADCTNRNVDTGPIEATAMGNILMQAVTLGHLGSLAEARALVGNSYIKETFNPSHQDGWDKAFEKLLSLCTYNCA